MAVQADVCGMIGSCLIGFVSLNLLLSGMNGSLMISGRFVKSHEPGSEDLGFGKGLIGEFSF
ncbi:hypothetical protein [Leptothermofonsia sp. ETS-13]|uniref:hypothetical protein n=1 Tax=Leptothermofonsia sp. ETS-13 TaxID=3035696 RepID=UPI003BA3BE19